MHERTEAGESEGRSTSERRMHRSPHRPTAARLLLEALAFRSDAHAVALIDDCGALMAGTGRRRDLDGLARIAGPSARGEPCPELDEVTRGTDVFVRGIQIRGSTVYLAALGTRMRRFSEAAAGVVRILG